MNVPLSNRIALVWRRDRFDYSQHDFRRGWLLRILAVIRRPPRLATEYAMPLRDCLRAVDRGNTGWPTLDDGMAYPFQANAYYITNRFLLLV